jgi:multimeric flavodoxin WrbA
MAGMVAQAPNPEVSGQVPQSAIHNPQSNMPSPIIILGTSRSKGNARLVAEFLAEQLNCDIIDLNDYTISYYDYEHRNEGDDFLPLMERIIANYDTLIFATPVYWYSMSAVMKTFFDRLSDLLTIRKPLGRQLRGKRMGAISVGYDHETVDGLDMPFRESANYLGMTYLRHVYAWVEEGKIADSPTEQLLALCDQVR